MITHIFNISQFIFDAFLHIWPYVLVTIPLAVAVRMSGASKYIKRAFEARPLIAILLATIVGAFSPFCSCGVIPVIASLLISGVPLAPVMSFWVASPSMDPEIFFLSVGMIGWNLAVWRLVATLILSLAAGYITHLLMQKKWLGTKILRMHKEVSVQSNAEFLKKGWQKIKDGFGNKKPSKPELPPVIPNRGRSLRYAPSITLARSEKAASCCSVSTETTATITVLPEKREFVMAPSTENLGSSPEQGCGCDETTVAFRQRLLKETLSATVMVIKFMALAFFLEALIILYVPQQWITAALGQNNPMAITTAALLGIPTYTGTLT
ncbi:MAG: permease, partial [Desulfobacterales bacterium]|nr:permease [Desulfobacterales bacterium]